MSDKCPDCPAPSADMDGFIVSGPGGAPRSESAGVSSSEGPFAKEAPQTGHFILKGKVSSSSPLPDVPEPGWAYEAAEAGTYGGVHATPGDLIWCAGVNPVRWAILQSDSGSAVSVQQVLSSGTKIATVTVDGQATDLFCNPSGLASVSASFECREESISLPLAFTVHLCEYWDDGETDGCYSQDAGNDPVDFSFISGVETKIATLQAIPEVSDTYYTLYIEIGDASYNGRSDRSDERDASDDTLYYCSARPSVGSQYIQVGESQDITFIQLCRSYRNYGETWRRLEITSISSTSVSINSDLFGQYTVSARIVREPNGPNGEYVISVYATATAAAESSGTTPVLSLTSTGADGTSSTQEVDMSCLAGLVPSSVPSEWEWNPTPVWTHTFENPWYDDDDMPTGYDIPASAFVNLPKNAMLVFNSVPIGNTSIGVRISYDLSNNKHYEIVLGSVCDSNGRGRFVSTISSERGVYIARGLTGIGSGGYSANPIYSIFPVVIPTDIVFANDDLYVTNINISGITTIASGTTISVFTEKTD